MDSDLAMADVQSIVTIAHWFPIITFCPVNRLPDFLFVTVVHTDRFVELYKARRKIRETLMWKTLFMEDAAERIKEAFPEAEVVTVRLMFNKHKVTLQEY